MAYLGSHREVEGREKENVGGPNVLLVLRSRVGPRLLRTHSLLMNLKHKSENSKHRKRDREEKAQMVSYQNQSRSLKQRVSGAERGSLDLHVVL